MTKHTFNATHRKHTGRSVKRLRAGGVVPANVFGNKVPSINIQINAKEFSRLRREVGESTLIYLKVEGEKEERPTLIRDVVIHPVSGQILHVSFHQVDLKEKVTAPVAVDLLGEPQAEKDKLGIMVQLLNEVEIEALPTNMPDNIQVDVSNLAAVGDNIKVGDLKLDLALTIKSDLEALIVKIEPLAQEEKVEVVAPTEGVGESPAEGETTIDSPAPTPAEEKSE